MTNLRQAAQQAIWALDRLHSDYRTRVGLIDRSQDDSMTVAAHNAGAALRAALAEPEEEPVAMRYDFDGYGYRYIDSGSGSNWQTRHNDAEPLYTRPVQALAEPEHDTDCHQSGICQRSGYSISAPRRPLTDDEIDRQWADEWDGFVSFVEAECIVRWTEQRHGITGESK